MNPRRRLPPGRASGIAPPNLLGAGIPTQVLPILARVADLLQDADEQEMAEQFGVLAQRESLEPAFVSHQRTLHLRGESTFGDGEVGKAVGHRGRRALPYPRAKLPKLSEPVGEDARLGLPGQVVVGKQLYAHAVYAQHLGHQERGSRSGEGVQNHVARRKPEVLDQPLHQRCRETLPEFDPAMQAFALVGLEAHQSPVEQMRLLEQRTVPLF